MLPVPQLGHSCPAGAAGGVGEAWDAPAPGAGPPTPDPPEPGTAETDPAPAPAEEAAAIGLPQMSQ